MQRIFMKAMQTKTESATLTDIVKTLKRVPKARLGVVRDLVRALATPQQTSSQHKVRAPKKVSLVDSPFCGMWKDREDITDGQTFARLLRETVEGRGDRRKNIR
jgi:hypothetical protein